MSETKKWTPEQAAQAVVFMEKLDQDAKTEAELEKKTDAEIADLLIEHVWGQGEIMGPRSVLVSVAAERLRAARKEKEP